MTEVSEFERELRAALSDVHAAAFVPTGLTDRLVEAATSGTARPHRVDVRPPRRWLPPLLAAAVVAIVMLTSVAVVKATRHDRVPPATPGPGLTTALVAPTSLLDVKALGFHVNPVRGLVPTHAWGLEPDYQMTGVDWPAGHVTIGVKVYYKGKSPALPPGVRELRPGTRQTVTVRGVTGTYVEAFPSGGDGHWLAQLVWEYAPGSWAEVVASNDHSPPPQAATRPAFLTIANAVGPGGMAVRLPYRVGTVRTPLPPAATISSVRLEPADFYGTGGWSSEVGDYTLGLFTNGTWCQRGVEPYGFGQIHPFTYKGHRGCLRGGVAGQPLLHVVLRVGGVERVIAGTLHKDSVDNMKRMLGDLTVAPSDNPLRWFDLRTALGG